MKKSGPILAFIHTTNMRGFAISNKLVGTIKLSSPHSFEIDIAFEIH